LNLRREGCQSVWRHRQLEDGSEPNQASARRRPIEIRAGENQPAIRLGASRIVLVLAEERGKRIVAVKCIASIDRDAEDGSGRILPARSWILAIVLDDPKIADQGKGLRARRKRRSQRE
jgi:hypothetical protein